MRVIVLVLVGALLAGCGGGGGSSAGSAVPPGKVTVEIGTQSGSATTVLYAVEFTLQLPSGVALAADSSGALSEGVLQPVDSAALAGARYLPATSALPATVKVDLIDPLGFAAGALASLNASVASGTTPDSSGFVVQDFSARDVNGAVMAGITPRLVVRTQ